MEHCYSIKGLSKYFNENFEELMQKFSHKNDFICFDETFIRGCTFSIGCGNETYRFYATQLIDDKILSDVQVLVAGPSPYQSRGFLSEFIVWLNLVPDNNSLEYNCINV
ncbi:MAG: hypothetical protein QXI33_00750 [Candidatus Pacearchaeota archaeon]